MAYSRLLRRYLEHKYKSVQQANRKYVSLTKLVEQFDGQKQKNIALFRQMDRTKLPQIILEVFDL